MRQIAYPAALGSCVLGAASPARAAEWSITPIYSSSVDYDSNRNLRRGESGSAAKVLSVDLQLKRALEDLELTLEPQYTWRRFTRSALGNGDDRSVRGAMNWVRERSTLNLTAGYFDQSTLVTEVLETGIVSGDTHRRSAQAAAAWTWTQTERRSLIAQISYQDVSYYGVNKALLPGFRYPSGNIEEQFLPSERCTLTLGVFGSRLQSDTEANSSHELGLQAGITYLWSQNTRIDASLGESKRVLTGADSHGTTLSAELNHTLELGKLTFSYKRSLVPYGFGFLSEQQQYGATFTRQLTPYLDSNLRYLRIRNNEATVLLRLDRHSYNTVSTGLSWRPAETWAVGTQLEYASTQTPEVEAKPVSRWRGAITITWFPLRTSRSW